MEQFRNGDLVFDVIDAGPADGPVVVLLHGFPESNAMYQPVIDRLTAQGYRCLAPLQRGYSPGARPKRRRAYRDSELAGDNVPPVDPPRPPPGPPVGHDLGAVLGGVFAPPLPRRPPPPTPLSG